MKTFDETPQGPASNGGYWRTFEVSDTVGNVIKGTAWGVIAENTWVKNVSADFYNATVRKKEQRVNLSEDAVVVFNDTYELGATAPKFFKTLGNK